MAFNSCNKKLSGPMAATICGPSCIVDDCTAKYVLFLTVLGLLSTFCRLDWIRSFFHALILRHWITFSVYLDQFDGGRTYRQTDVLSLVN